MKKLELIQEILLVGLLLFFAYLTVSNNILSFESYNNSDIHRGFQRAVSIAHGVNPYLEFNPNQMLEQEKVPGFFPFYFYAMSVIAKISDYSFPIYLDNLRTTVFFAYIILGLTIYMLMRKKGRFLALFALVLFLFNRWTVNDVMNLKQDTYVILILFVSLALLKKTPLIAFLLYGVATGLKHLTILAFPVYALELINLARNSRMSVGRAVVYTMIFMVPLVIPTIPYLMKTPDHFINAMLYNGTRVPEATGLDKNSGLNKMFVLYNQDRFNSKIFYALPRLPMLLLISYLTYGLFSKKLNMWKYTALAYLVFISFNPVVYSQYFTWVFASIMLWFRDS